ncbi:radical SAM/SPASM domain-containing protein [Bacteroides graminisolvens]|uniref:radical SAM/SPASM domain-containing protein n=1 Tax=Bacteroides graminisolvens TaxID=477666 RepID=UPI0029C726C0|nr:radical SAM protein [Bacteroides graminisolvens]
MYFKQKSNVIFRNYGSFGYITDNRNFGYKLTNSNEDYIGDKILSETGSAFFSVLDRNPQPFDELVTKINKIFTEVDISTIQNDAREFYLALEKDGFIVSGETSRECENNDTRFLYNNLVNNTVKKSLNKVVKSSERDTQDFFEEYFKGKPQLTNLHMEITSKCNERCLHCYIPHEKKVNAMEPSLFYNILEQCKEMNVLHLTLSGGEPMLHKDLCDFLQKCREYNFSVNILTNLTLLDNKILQEMKANPLLGIQVSLYSMDSNIHDGITQVKGSFEKTKNGILRLIENDIPLQISCPIMKQNKDCYDDVVKWAEKYKIHVADDFVIIARYNNTTQNLDCRLSLDEVKNIIKNKSLNDINYLDAIKIAAEKKRYTTPNDYVCSVCHSSICIAENGNVYPCAGWQGYIVGNVKENLLNDIWNNSGKVNYLRELRNHDFPKCIQCKDKNFCTMCMVRNANESPTGDPLAVNKYFCDIGKFNKKAVLKFKEKA